jgi:hypothetical protein
MAFRLRDLLDIYLKYSSTLQTKKDRIIIIVEVVVLLQTILKVGH